MIEHVKWVTLMPKTLIQIDISSIFSFDIDTVRCGESCLDIINLNVQSISRFNLNTLKGDDCSGAI